jgi:hypothetical protein
MSNVTPIKPGVSVQSSGESPANGDALVVDREREERDRQRIQDRCYQAASIVLLVTQKLHAISGDEDALDIAEQSATWSSALDAAKRVMEDVAEDVRQFKPAEAQQ